MNILRRLPLSRLLLLCGLVVLIGVSATALAFAVGAGPVPKPEPLAVAVHSALEGPAVEGVSASVTLTDHLLEGASLSGSGETGELTSSPLITGASGRLWISKDGRVRIELQAAAGDTQILYDGHTATVYDAATNTVYRYTPPPEKNAAAASHSAGADTATQIQKSSSPAGATQPPTLAQVEKAIAHLERHADVSGATPTDIAGRPAYTVRLSPTESGSLFGGAEISFDAAHGAPLRAALFSSTAGSPVVELTADQVSYGPVESSIFAFSPPADAKVVEIDASQPGHSGAADAHHPPVRTFGHGPSTIAVLEGKATGKGSAKLPEGLPKVKIDGVSAAELPTELGTLLSFELNGVRYLLAGSVTPASIESVARGL